MSIVFILSCLLQLAAAVLALNLVKITGHRTAWILISLGLVLMTGRRIVSFMAHDLPEPYHHYLDDAVAFLSLGISLVMVFGVYYTGVFFREYQADERALRDRNRVLGALYDSARAMGAQADPKDVSRAICEAAVEAFGASLAWIGLVSPYHTRLEPLASAGEERGFTEAISVRWDESPEGKGPAGTAVKERKPCVRPTEHLSMEPWREALESRNFRIVCALPLLYKDEVRGSLQLLSTDAEAFGPDSMSHLEVFAAHAAMAVVNARYYDEARISIEELSDLADEYRRLSEDHQRAAEEARVGEARYRDLLENARTIMIKWDTEGAITYWNDFAHLFFGFSREEAIGRSLFDTVVPPMESTGRDLRRLHDSIAADPDAVASSVNENHLKDGRRVWMVWTHRPVLDEAGKPVEVLSCGTDITALKTAEIRQRASGERYQALVENARAIVLTWDPGGRVCFWNDFAEQFFGYAREEIIGKSLFGTIVPRTESTGRDLKRLLLDIGRDPDEYASNVNENITKDGRRVWVAWSNRPILDEHGNIREVLSHGTDITEFRRSGMLSLQAGPSVKDLIRKRNW